MEQQTQKMKGMLAIFIGVVLASGTGILVKMSFSQGADTMTVISLRMLFSLPLFIVSGLWYYWKKAWRIDLRFTDIFKICGVGLLGYYLTSYTNFIGLQYISASMERVVMFTFPTMVLIMSAIFWRRRILIEQVIAIKITYLGLIVCFSAQFVLGDNANITLGGLFILLSAFLFALNILLSKELILRHGPMPVTIISFMASSVAILLQYSLSHSLDLFQQKPELYINASIMSVLTTFLPAILLGYAMKILSAVEVSVLSCIGPPASFIFAVAFLGEHISSQQVWGTIIVIAGVVFLQLGGFKPIGGRLLLKSRLRK